MDKNEKLFRKLSPKDRLVLGAIVTALKKNELEGLNIMRLETNLYRIRKGNFRIIFHYDTDGAALVDVIRLRNERTYRDL